jgi:hypothetical protein
LLLVLSTFSNKAAITKSFAELRHVWLQYESEDAWNQTLEQFEIAGEQYRSFGNAKRCFTALWRAVEKMVNESKEVQPA